MRLNLEFESFTEEFFMNYLVRNESVREVLKSPPGQHQFGKSKALLNADSQRTRLDEPIVLLHKPTAFMFLIAEVSMRLDFERYRGGLGVGAWEFFFLHDNDVFRKHFGNMAASSFGLSGTPEEFIENYMWSRGGSDFMKQLLLVRV